MSANDIVAKLWREMQQSGWEAEEKRAKADPVKHRLTTVFRKGLQYSYYEIMLKGRRVRFCYSKHPNVAGYHLIWRETITRKKGGKRDQWDSTTSHRAARRVAGELYEAYRAKREATKATKATEENACSGP